MTNWEDTFSSWAKGPGDTERQKCENAETAIRKAINAHTKLIAMDVSVFPQGSYRHKTNVRANSDVDICVCLNSIFFADYPTGKSNTDFGNSDSDLSFGTYKYLVQEALIGYFGAKHVSRGDKAFNIHENSYRLDADVVAAIAHKRYRIKDDGEAKVDTGIGFDTDGGKRITNWPNQNYDQNLSKHEATGRRFRKVIRILKRLRNRMQDEKIGAANGIASCLIEHLVYNVPNTSFNRDTLQQDVREVLAHIFNHTRTDEECTDWVETNYMEWLFRGTKQPWTRDKAHTFISAAWDYLGLE